MLPKIWKEQPSGYYSTSIKKGLKGWKDYFFDNIQDFQDWFEEHKDKEEDLYFCTTPLKEPKRTKDNVLGSRYLWQDLDESDPRKLPDSLKPTIAWRSSPGRYQALWRLDKVYKPSQVERLNKSLAKAVHADPEGSWILTKVLRIPGTKNLKYEDHPKVKLLWSDGPSYIYDRLAEKIGLAEQESDEPSIKEPIDKGNLLYKYWDKIPPKVRRFLVQTHATQGKRSDILWSMELDLAKAGFNTDEIYSLVKHSVWNKFKDRSDEKKQLMRDISKAIAKVASEPDEEFEPEDDEDNDSGVMHLVLENDSDLMTNMAHYPGWLVDGFWTRNSHGIVAGEPKSFKSTLAMDLAVSVASGLPFLGQFEVHEPGPVLIVQNENAPWIMKDRMNKIRTAKGLHGEVTRSKNGKLHVQFPPNLPIYYLNQQGFSFDNEIHKEILVKIIKKVHPVLILFDPLYLMFAGDVNTSKDLNPVLTWLLKLKDKYKCSIVLIHHWKKGTTGTKIRGGQRILGSTVLHGWIESAWYIEVAGMTEDESKKKSDTDDELASIKSPSANVKLIFEREFRGAGTYPKMDMEIHMGEFGSSKYEVKIGRHSSTRGKKITQDTESDMVRVIRDYLDQRKGREVPIRELQRETGYSRTSIRNIMEKMK